MEQRRRTWSVRTSVQGLQYTIIRNRSEPVLPIPIIGPLHPIMGLLLLDFPLPNCMLLFKLSDADACRLWPNE
jgi:hypothetical protein